MKAFLRDGIAIALLIVASTGNTRAHDIHLPESFDELALSEIAAGTFVLHGMQALPDPVNKGFMSNSGILLTEKGVVIIDSGGSAEVAAAMLERISDLTDAPVIAIFNTHVHGDHWLGNAEVLRRYPGIPIFAHERAIERLEGGEASAWIATMAGLIQHEASGEDLSLPTSELSGGESLAFGSTELRVHHTGHAHTDSDIMLEVPGRRLVFAGDVIEYGRAVSSDVPADFSAKGQIEAINHLLSLDVDLFVPGHGPTGGREIAEASRDFLTTLYDSVARHYEQGLLDYEMRALVEADMSGYADWANFEELGRLVSYVYLQVEEAAWE